MQNQQTKGEEPKRRPKKQIQIKDPLVCTLRNCMKMQNWKPLYILKGLGGWKIKMNKKGKIKDGEIPDTTLWETLQRCRWLRFLLATHCWECRLCLRVVCFPSETPGKNYIFIRKWFSIETASALGTRHMSTVILALDPHSMQTCAGPTVHAASVSGVHVCHSCFI